MPPIKKGAVLALDAAGRAFTFDPGDSRVKRWVRHGRMFRTAQGGFLLDNLYLLDRQWYRQSGFERDFDMLTDAPNYARPVTREQARDWFLAAGVELPDELADLAPDAAPPPAKPKRSTERGEAVAKLIAALSQHHGYGSHNGLRYDAIGNNDLAKIADVGKATTSAFFKTEFGGHGKYKAMCAKDRPALARHLIRLNGEPMSHFSYGRTPPGEGIDDDRAGA
jgi:hypothetical protein